MEGMCRNLITTRYSFITGIDPIIIQFRTNDNTALTARQSEVSAVAKAAARPETSVVPTAVEHQGALAAVPHSTVPQDRNAAGRGALRRVAAAAVLAINVSQMSSAVRHKLEHVLQKMQHAVDQNTTVTQVDCAAKMPMENISARQDHSAWIQ